MMLSKQQPCAHQICQQPNSSHEQHPVRLHLGRIQKAMVRFIKNVERNQNQKDTVQQRDEDFDPVETVRLLRSRAPGRERESQRN